MYFGHQQVIRALKSCVLRSRQSCPMSAGLVGDVEPLSRGSFTHLGLTHAKSSQSCSLLCPGLGTAGHISFHSSLENSIFSLARFISSSPPVELLLFLWKILEEFLSITLTLPILQHHSSSHNLLCPYRGCCWS